MTFCARCACGRMLCGAKLVLLSAPLPVCSADMSASALQFDHQGAFIKVEHGVADLLRVSLQFRTLKPDTVLLYTDTMGQDTQNTGHLQVCVCVCACVRVCRCVREQKNERCVVQLEKRQMTRTGTPHLCAPTRPVSACILAFCC